MKSRAFSAVALAAIIIISIFSPAVMASTVYGPAQFERDDGKPVRVNDSFSLDHVYGNYTLCIRNGDGAINTSSSSLILLNGIPVVGPEDFNQNVELIQKNVSLEAENDINIEVEMRSTPGSQITLWIEDESPLITIDSPSDDTVSNENVTISGSVDPLINSDLNLTCNGIATVLLVENGNFSTELDITGPSNITIFGTDLAGRVHSTTLLLDGDMLPESYEYQLGFDPLNPDSDSTMTPENEAGNGISDGMEMLGGQLPSFVKSCIGAVPFSDDSDSDGLSDYFELMKLGLLTEVNSPDSDGDGVSDPEEDPDSDDLSNLEEQTYGTDPLIADSDEDSLSDGFEINSSGTDPLLIDTDGDGLSDDSELRLGTDPLNPDSDGDGIPDGDETYVSTMTDDALGVTVEIEGTGDLAKEVVIYEETSELFTNNSALVSPVVDFSLDNRTFENAQITIPYDPAKVTDPTNLSLFYFNESAGTFEPVESTVDPVNHTVTGLTSHFSTFAIFYVPTWNALFEAEMNLGREGGNGSNVVYVDVVFAMDSSGSMSWNDPNGYRKTAAKNFVGSLLSEDRAGVVDFDSYSSLIRPLTSDFNAVNSSINSLDASGGTNIGAGMSTANSHLINSGDPEHAWMVILLTDGQGSYSNTYTQQAINNNITVYTVGLGSDVDTALLTGIATATGGQYFSVSTAEDLPDVFRTISEEIEPTDTDGDGIPDITETTGFRDGFGNWYYTDSNNSDTDGDGLLDGDEAGVVTTVDGRVFFHFISNPLKIDSDNDGIDDPDEEEFSCAALDPDTDNDWLNDGFELEIGTEPTLTDTDFDGLGDFAEHYHPLFDPLVYEKHYSNEEISREFVLGAVLGEFGYDNHDSFYYLAGHIVSGLVALGDIRDMGASIIDGNVVDTLLNCLGLVPLGGDAAKILTNIGQFVAKHADEAGDIAIFSAKFIPAGAFREQAVEAVIDSSDELKDARNGLIAKGFTDNAVKKLTAEGIDIIKFNEALHSTGIFSDYPELKAFLEAQLTSENGVLKERVTLNAKKLVAAQRKGNVQSYVDGFANNLKGAYTEQLTKDFIGGTAVVSLSHVNKGGIDYAGLSGNTLKIGEAKAVQSLSMPKLKNYILPGEVPGTWKFNTNYAIENLESDFYFKDSGISKEFVLYINSPESSTIKNSLISQLGDASEIPYKYTKSGQEYTGMVKITIEAVSK